MPFYIFAWIAALASGFTVVISKLTTKYAIKNPWYFNFLLMVSLLIFTVPLALANHASIPHDWLPIILTAICWVCFWIFYVLSLYRLDLTVISPLFNLGSVFSILIGVLLLGERYSLLSWGVVALIVVASVLTTMDERMQIRSFLTPSIGIMILCVLSLAFYGYFVNLSLEHNDLWATNLWILIFSVILLLPTFPLFRHDVQKTTKLQIGSVVAFSLFQTIVTLSANAAYEINISTSALIIALPTSMIYAVILSIFKPDLLEKHTPKVYAIRFTAAVVIIAGALQLSK